MALGFDFASGYNKRNGTLSQRKTYGKSVPIC